MPEQLQFAVSKKLDPQSKNDKSDLFASLSSSVFKETNTNAADLLGLCANRLSDNLKLTAAYQTLERSLIEFVNNSEQAHATQVTIACHVDPEQNRIRFVIHDNGNGFPKEYITTRYDWEEALQKRSLQAAPEEGTVKKSSGQHLGVSTAAYLLERQEGNLSLENNKEKGARITITSSLKPCDSIMFDQPSEDDALKINDISPRNIVEEMLHCLIKKQPEDDTKMSALQTILRNSASQTLQNAAKSVKQRLHVSPLMSPNKSPFGLSPLTPNLRKRPSGLTNLSLSMNSNTLFSIPPALNLNTRPAEEGPKPETPPHSPK